MEITYQGQQYIAKLWNVNITFDAQTNISFNFDLYDVGTTEFNGWNAKLHIGGVQIMNEDSESFLAYPTEQHAIEFFLKQIA